MHEKYSNKNGWSFDGTCKIKDEGIDFNYFNGKGIFGSIPRDLAVLLGGKPLVELGIIDPYTVEFRGEVKISKSGSRDGK